MTSSVYIAKNVYGGDGMGRLGDGRVIFTPGAFAGENVKAEIVEEKRNFVKARLVEVVDPSPDRVEPGLTVPGMVYAALSFKAENAVKEEQLRDFFERARIKVGEFSPFESAAYSPFNYRNKVTYHFEKVKGRWILGYRTEPSHEIVEVTEDPLAVKEINAKLPEIRRQVMMLLSGGAGAVRKSVEKEGNLTVRWTRRSGVQWWIGSPRPRSSSRKPPAAKCSRFQATDSIR